MTKLTLDSVEWKEFKFTDIFTKIQRGKRLTKGDQIEGGIPYVSSTSINNGVDNFISNEENIRKFENCLTLANSGSVGSCFYQQYEFIGSDHVTILENKNFSKEVYLFLSSIIKRLEEKYSFNREINDARIRRETVILPVNSKGSPHWQFMEDYIKQERRKQAIQIRNYYEPKLLMLAGELAGLEEVRTISFHRDFQKSQSIEWKEFWLEDVCEIKSGKDIYERERIVGKIPYITATASQNGIGYFIGNSNTTLEQGCLSVNRNGSVGYSFYHDYLALFGNDTRKLKLKEQNKYVGLFISRIITNQKEKYGYGYKMGTARLKRQKIMLPVNADGTIAYGYMVDQMKWLEFKEIYKILSAIR